MPILVSLLVFYIILYPKEIIEATKAGISIWVNSVLPSLLPFFIGVEILSGLGVVKFIGTLIEPIVRPLFKVPGEASFVFAMSITSGYPIGVKLTADLRKKGIITKDEAQRMISFCSTSGPLFIIGAVSVGMFQNEAIGSFITIAHYLGAVLVGLIFRNYRSNSLIYCEISKSQNIIKKAFNDMLKARKDDGRSFGKLLGDSVREAISTQLLVGGIIVLFSVIIKEISLLGIIDYIKLYFNNLITNSGNIINVLLTGFIELTIGCKMVSETIVSPTLQVVLVTMIISWSGLSVHAQAASFMNDTDINISLYVISKLLHSILSGFIVLILFLTKAQNYFIKEVFNYTTVTIEKYTWFQKLFFSTELFTGITLALIVFGIIYFIIKN